MEKEDKNIPVTNLDDANQDNQADNEQYQFSSPTNGLDASLNESVVDSFAQSDGLKFPQLESTRISTTSALVDFELEQDVSKIQSEPGIDSQNPLNAGFIKGDKMSVTDSGLVDSILANQQVPSEDSLVFLEPESEPVSSDTQNEDQFLSETEINEEQQDCKNENHEVASVDAPSGEDQDKYVNIEEDTAVENNDVEEKESFVAQQCSVETNSNNNADLSSETKTLAQEYNNLVDESSCSDPEVEQLMKLPSTVTELTSKEGVRIYIVGTAHFSLESQEDVAKTILMTRPRVVMVELCFGRRNILHLDEQTILEEAQNLSLAKVQSTLKQYGTVQGALYLLFLSTSAHLTRQLGMAPGGEFRRAFNEARNVPGCRVHLGDRPIHKDLLEEMLEEMTGEFPALSQVFVQERDLCLAHSLQLAAADAAKEAQDNKFTEAPAVVGVVGIGHVAGIVDYFGKVTELDVRNVMRVPPPSRTGYIILTSARLSIIGLVAYGCYKLAILSLFILLVTKMAEENSDTFMDNYEHVDSSIIYTPANIPGPGVEESIFETQFEGCQCTGICASGCSCSGRCGMSYNEEGLVDITNCSLIYECHDYCQCTINICLNRQVQKGPNPNLQIINSLIKGYGLISKVNLKRGMFVCEYAGEVIGIEEAKIRLKTQSKGSKNYIFALREHFGSKLQMTFIDPTHIGNIGRYINHSCQPNLSIIPVRTGAIIPRLCLFANQDIEAYTELSFDYSGGYETEGASKSTRTVCCCGTAACRGFLPFDETLL
nr:EOG090X0AQH [Cyclestheria hislopi]